MKLDREKGICLKCKDREGCYLWRETKDTKIYECQGFLYDPELYENTKT